MSSLPDCLLRNKKQFLEMMAAPRPFTELKMDDVRIRLLGDFATIHSHMTFRTKTVCYVKVDIPTIASDGMENGSAWLRTLSPKACKEV
jgi:hypothetical protein